MGRITTNLNLESEHTSWLDEEARRLGISRSELVNRLLTDTRKRYYKEQVAEAVVDAGLGSASLGFLLVLALVLV